MSQQLDVAWLVEHFGMDVIPVEPTYFVRTCTSATTAADGSAAGSTIIGLFALPDTACSTSYPQACGRRVSWWTAASGRCSGYPAGYPDVMSTPCGPTEGPDTCAVNMGMIHLQAGDLVSAYRFFVPMAEKGDTEAINRLVEICERAGDTARAETWRAVSCRT